MTTYCYTHKDNVAHDPGPDHSERAARLEAIMRELQALKDPRLVWQSAPLVPRVVLSLVHTQEYIDFLFKSVPTSGYREIEINEVVSEHDAGEVTVLCPRSGDAILRSVGGGIEAVHAVMRGQADNAFCLSRPPGHHALPDKAMGFCAVNNIAVTARYAQRAYGLKRVAIVDFDVHHGNGTQAIFENDPSVFFASIHQLPLWPETGHAHETGAGNILNVPVGADLPRQQWLEIWRNQILARLEREAFDLLLVSAGFDAHKDDPKGAQNLETEDYATLMQDLMRVADKTCGGRVIAMLEGGYDIEGSAKSAAAMTSALLSASTFERADLDETSLLERAV